MIRAIKGLSIAALAIACAPSVYAACAAPIYNSDVSVFGEADYSGAEPGTVFPVDDDGITNGSFSRCDDSAGIQLGLRISERFVGQITPTDDTYVAPQGAADDGNALWNYDVHIDMGWLYGQGTSPLQLGDLDSLVLQVDCDPAVGVVAGPAVDLSKLSAFLPTLFPPTALLMQISDNLGFPLRCPGMEFDPAADGSYEFSLTATMGGVVISQAEATALVGSPPEPPPPGENANFTVVTAYSDLNPAPVEVTLTCNGGVPLVQSYTLTPVTEGEENFVTFTLTEFADGGPSCTVSQAPVAGYTTEYEDFTQIGTVDAEGCHYDAVALGTHAVCGTGNIAAAVDVTVTKVWELIDEFDASSDIDLLCSNVVPGTQTTWNWTSDSSVEGGEEDFVAMVSPLADGSTSCVVSETNSSSAVTVTGCEAPIDVAAGATDAGCTLTNTLFFEGVPTMNQYTIALLVLLMAGLGFVGIRRIA